MLLDFVESLQPFVIGTLERVDFGKVPCVSLLFSGKFGTMRVLVVGNNRVIRNIRRRRREPGQRLTIILFVIAILLFRV